MSLDPRSPSMNLWHRLVAAGVSEDEATALMNGYAHELAERIRVRCGELIEAAGPRTAPTDPKYDVAAGHADAANLIDPEVQQPPVDEYRLSTRPGVVSGQV